MDNGPLGKQCASPLGPSIVPVGINAVMNASGTVSVKWKSAPPSPQYYQLRRQLNGTGDYVTLALQTDKTFTDATVPTGTASALYRVFGYRGSETRTDYVTVGLNFGSGSGSGDPVTVVVPQTRLAA